MARTKSTSAEAKVRTEARVSEITSRLLDAWQSGDMPKAIARTMLSRQSGDVRPMDGWSLLNRLSVMFGGTDDARGFDQWKTVGRTVKKGAKALYILGPVIKKIEDDEGEKKPILIGFRTIPVFRVEDTEGEPLTVADYNPPTLPPLVEVAEAWGIKVSYQSGNGSAYGYYTLGEDTITLNSHDPNVFWHELSHAAHQRVLQARGEKLNGGQVESQEIVAETCAAALSLMYGHEGYVATGLDYVRGYAKEATTKAVMRVMADIEKTLTLILDTAACLAAPRQKNAA